MAVFFASLNSGSNGNCYYIGNEKEAILVDAGISCREIEKRMKQLELPIQKIKAVFISHEHGDHIRGLSVLAEKYQLPVYITTATLQQSEIKIDKQLVKKFSPQTAISIGGLSIKAFSKNHDACDPHSFTVSCDGINIGVFTDIGVACEQLTSNFKICHAAFLEANYDTEMLDKGNYPYHLKKRIRNGQGHLSNKQALEVFLQHRSAQLSHLLLSHLSKNNNCPKLVQELFEAHANGVIIIVTSRYEATAVYKLENDLMPFYPPIAASQMSFAFA